MPKPFILLLFACLASVPVYAQKKINVLFLGNSLTYYNNLPELVKQIAAL